MSSGKVHKFGLAILSVLFLALATNLAFADEKTRGTKFRLNWSGYLRANYFSSSRSLDDEDNFFGLTTGGKILFYFNNHVDGKIDGRLGISDFGKGKNTSVSDLREAYLNARTHSFEWRIGKQIVAWGRADALNPTDVVTPRDYTVLLPFDEDQRTGILGVTQNYYFTKNMSLSLFASPDFKPSKIPLPEIENVHYEFEKTSLRDNNWMFAAKLNHSGGNVDWSVSAFRGRSLLPQADSFEVNADESVSTNFRYPNIMMFGGDLAKSIGDYGLRFEGAFIRPENKGIDKAIGMKPYFYYVLGADRTFISTLNVNLQFFQRIQLGGNTPGDIQDPMQRDLAELNAFIFSQKRRVTSGLTFRIAKSWLHETLFTELFFQGYLDGQGVFAQPQVQYAINDAWKVTVGGQIYGGSESSLFGVMKKNNGAYVEMRYSFGGEK